VSQQLNVPPRLEAFALSTRFGGFTVLDGASFMIYAKVMALTGANGVGKTTLLRALVGADPADQGRVEVCSFDLDEQPLQAKSLLSFVPAEMVVYPFIRGCEFLRFVNGVRGVQFGDHLTSLIEAFQLAKHLNKRFDRMSLGTQHKFMLAAALSTQPKVLVMDEPTNTLDADSLDFLQQYLIDSQGKRAVLFASHNMRFVQACASGVLHLEDGGVKAA
jgi:ABC-2 type transport system ATP-binding protein